MKRYALLVALLVLSQAQAARVPSTKTVMLPSTGARSDITVPYLTNGRTTLGVAQGVAPRIIVSPLLNDSPSKRMQNVYNLPFYGGKLGPSPADVAATPRPPNTLRPRK